MTTGLPVVGEGAPVLVLDTLDGEAWSLHPGRGRTVVLFFIREFT